LTEQTATATAAPRRGRTQAVDFTRPTKFTPDHERRLHRAFSAFCRTSTTRLSAELRLPTELELHEVSQLTWSNAHDQVSPTSLCAVVELQPHGTRALLAADLGFVLTGIESLLGGPCEEPPPERRLTEIDLALARRLLDGMLGQMAVVWRDLTGADLRLAELDTHMETAQVAPVSEPTLALRMRARLQGNEHALTLLVPHRAIAPVEGRILGRNGDDRAEPSPAERRRLRDLLAGVEVSLRAEIEGPELPAARVLLLKPGDTLDLEARVDAGLGLCVDGVQVLRADPGRSGTRRAVQVREPVDPGIAESLAQPAAEARRAPAEPRPGEPNPLLSRSIGGVPVRVWAELGSAEVPLSTLLGLGSGSVLELNRRIDDPIDLYVNGFRFGSGELLVTADREWAIRLDEVSGLGARAGGQGA